VRTMVDVELADRGATWTEMLARMEGAAFPYASGVVRYHEPNDQEATEQSVRFWFRRSTIRGRSSIRIDDELGLRAMHHDGVTFLREAPGRIQRFTHGISWHGPGDPRRMVAGHELGHDYRNPNDYSVPRDQHGERVEVDGRHGWRFVLQPPPHKEHDLVVTIDDATGCVLELRSLGVDAHATLTDLDVDTPVDDDRFEYDGETFDDLQRAHDERAASARVGARLGLVTIVVDDYDEAIRFFVDALGFDLVEDSPSTTDDGRPKRWVVVRPQAGDAGILLAQADGAAQRARVGDQLGGRVGFFLHVDDFGAQYARMLAHGVRFDEAPRYEAYGTVVVFRDLAGNRWDLLGPP
jgi:catechol 2,3-dioxygenase-like lactoylglutathione lyase family enzyme